MPTISSTETFGQGYFLYPIIRMSGLCFKFLFFMFVSIMFRIVIDNMKVHQLVVHYFVNGGTPETLADPIQ